MKKFLLSLVFVLCTGLPGAARAETAVNAAAAQSGLNTASPNQMFTHRLGDRVVAETEHMIRATYDVAKLGGAVGAVTLIDVSTGQPAKLPKGAIVRNCAIDVITAPSPAATASATPTLAIGTGQAVNDLKAAATASGYTGLVACVPVGSVGTAIKMTADRTLSATVAADGLAAGKMYVIVEYELSSTL